MNRIWNPKTFWVLPFAGILVLAALPAEAQRPAAEEGVAAMSVRGGAVSFAPRADVDRMTLTVSGRGHAYSETFDYGQTATFVPVDAEGYALPDGTYNWELVSSPSPRNLRPRAFASGRVSANGRSVEEAKGPQGRLQSGVFTILNGAIVDSSQVEEEGSRFQGRPASNATPSAGERAAEQIDRDN
jgi:hypothetical protein